MAQTSVFIAQSDQYLHSFLPRTIRTWNLLPQDIVSAPSPDSFRSKLVKSIKDGTIVIGGKCTGSLPSHPILAFYKTRELFKRIFLIIFYMKCFILYLQHMPRFLFYFLNLYIYIIICSIFFINPPHSFKAN